jgi:hypothetical protein
MKIARRFNGGDVGIKAISPRRGRLKKKKKKKKPMATRHCSAGGAVRVSPARKRWVSNKECEPQRGDTTGGFLFYDIA